MGRKFGTKTKKGEELVAKHQATYEKWWVGKEVDSTQIINGIPAKGKVLNVKYIGNSMSGCVQVNLDNGCEMIISPLDGGYKPNKDDLWYT